MKNNQSLGVIEEWKKIMSSGQTSNISKLIHEDAIFYSPVVFSPQKGKKKVIKYLSSAVEIFKNKNFLYKKIYNHKDFTFAEFEANFNNVIVNGIDLISTQNNLIYEKEYIEKYAKHIGMIYKRIYDVKKDIATQEILSGVDYKLKVIAYGKE